MQDYFLSNQKSTQLAKFTFSCRSRMQSETTMSTLFWCILYIVELLYILIVLNSSFDLNVGTFELLSLPPPVKNYLRKYLSFHLVINYDCFPNPMPCVGQDYIKTCKHTFYGDWCMKWAGITYGYSIDNFSLRFVKQITSTQFGFDHIIGLNYPTTQAHHVLVIASLNVLFYIWYMLYSIHYITYSA